MYMYCFVVVCFSVDSVNTVEYSHIRDANVWIKFIILFI